MVKEVDYVLSGTVSGRRRRSGPLAVGLEENETPTMMKQTSKISFLSRQTSGVLISIAHPVIKCMFPPRIRMADWQEG